MEKMIIIETLIILALWLPNHFASSLEVCPLIPSFVTLRDSENLLVRKHDDSPISIKVGYPMCFDQLQDFTLDFGFLESLGHVPDKIADDFGRSWYSITYVALEGKSYLKVASSPPHLEPLSTRDCQQQEPSIYMIFEDSDIKLAKPAPCKERLHSDEGKINTDAGGAIIDPQDDELVTTIPSLQDLDSMGLFSGTHSPILETIENLGIIDGHLGSYDNKFDTISNRDFNSYDGSVPHKPVATTPSIIEQLGILDGNYKFHDDDFDDKIYNPDFTRYDDYKPSVTTTTSSYRYRGTTIFIPVGGIIFVLSVCIRYCCCRKRQMVQRVCSITVVRPADPEAQAFSSPDVVRPSYPTDEAPAYADIVQEPPPPSYAEIYPTKMKLPTDTEGPSEEETPSTDHTPLTVVSPSTNFSANAEAEQENLSETDTRSTLTRALSSGSRTSRSQFAYNSLKEEV